MSYTTRTEAIAREIIEPIEASGIVAVASDEFDVDAIADEVLGGYGSGYTSRVEPEEFWTIVEKHAR